MHACHGHRYRPSPVPLSGTGKKRGEGVRGDCLHWQYKGVGAVRPESVACKGWFEVLLNLECHIGLRQKRNMKEIWCKLDGPSKNKELWS